MKRTIIICFTVICLIQCTSPDKEITSGIVSTEFRNPDNRYAGIGEYNFDGLF